MTRKPARKIDDKTAKGYVFPTGERDDDSVSELDLSAGVKMTRSLRNR